MKRLASTLSIAALLAASGPAWANLQYEAGASPQPAPARQAAQAAQAWHVMLTPANPALLHKLAAHASGKSGVAIAQSLVDAAHRSGFRYVHATVDPATSAIALQIFPTFATHGPMTGYLPAGKLVTKARLDDALPLLSAAAVAEHVHVDLGVNPETMTMAPALTATPGRAYGGGLVLSSYGPRYAGSDVMSGYGYAHADGWNISGSVTRGLPGLTPKQSAGGGYLGESVRLSRPTPDGVFALAISHAHYRTGGILRPLDLTGNITQLQAGWKYPVLAGHVWVRGGLAYASDSETLGVLGWTTTQKNFSAYAGLAGHDVWHHALINARATVWHGLAGSDTTSAGSPNLMGTWSAGYAVERIRVSAHRQFGPVMLHGVFGAQHGSAGTPAVMQSYIGGEHRGSSFFTGSFSGPSGYWWSASASAAKPITAKIRGVKFAVVPYAGLNGGSVMPVFGPNVRVSSVAAGVKFNLGGHVSGLAGYSHTISAPSGVKQSSLFNFELVSRF
jgi:hemolysin activation/secretion protein